MTIALSGNTKSQTWTGGPTSQTVACDFGSAQANSILIMATAVNSQNTIAPVVLGITDTRGNKWNNSAIFQYSSWAGGGIQFSGNNPVALTTQIWYAYDTASPATGYQATLSIGSGATNDAGSPVSVPLDAGICHLARLSGVSTDYPWDRNQNASYSNLINLPYGTTATPQQNNAIGSNTSDIAVLCACSGVGTLQYPSLGNNFTNNGSGLTFPVVGQDVDLKSTINGFFDGGPAVNALGLALYIKCGVVGPWNLSNNSLVNQNNMSAAEYMSAILTASAQTHRVKPRSRIIT